MKRTILLILTALWALSALAQDKMISSKQLMDWRLYPQSPMRGFHFEAGNQLSYKQDGKTYMVTFKNGKLSEPKEVTPEPKAQPQFDIPEGAENLTVCGENYAYTLGNDLYFSLNGKESNTEKIRKERKGIVYGQSVHRNEFGINGGIFWSPKGNKLAYYEMDESMVAEYPMVKTNPKTIATTEPFRYPMAGEKSHQVRVRISQLIDIEDIKDVLTSSSLETRRNNSVAEKEMYLTNLTWSPDEQYLYIAKVNREQNHMWLERYNVESGKLDKVLFEETNPRYVEPCEGLYFLPKDSGKFLWFSKRDGYKHLYLYQTDGTLVKQLTQGEFDVMEVIGFDQKGQNLFIYSNKENPAGRAAYRVNLKSGKMVRLTPVEGTHTVLINDEGTQMIDIYDAVNQPRVAEIVDLKTLKRAQLYSCENPLKDYAMPGVELGTIKAADGKTDLYYRLITPPNMEPGEKYPTLVYVYGGPHSQLVTDSWLGGSNTYFMFLAQQGYVVFTVDNRGTDNRGFEFESCTHRQLGTIEMADQMEGVKFLQSLPYVDKDRMGVEGWSFGGFMTISLKLAHPEVFKVGCAGGPVINWAWYEVMYGERYMDTPQENPEGYAANCLIDKAKDLEGRLLVIHGAEDNTVVWQHSIEFIEACINNGRQVDYFFYPHHEHNVRGPERVHLYEKMFDYYETHLK